MTSERISDSPVAVPQLPGSVREDYRTILINGIPLLDVRAPVEYERGAFPSSVNLPLMSDDERHQVGIRYKEAGQQSAVELGAELVTPAVRAERVAAWKRFIEQHPDGALYCFRGGLRSRITQLWLKEAGLEVPLVSGGYKALRSFLIDSMKSLTQTLPITLIGGRTGNGKTLLIKQLGRTIDLEAIANHRGSSFGGLATTQPRNIDFENSVTIELLKLADAGSGVVYLEDEAKLIGRVCLPDVLRDAMQAAPILILRCDMSLRIKNCLDDYVTDLLSRYEALLGSVAGFEAYAMHHRNSLARIQKRFGGANYQKALALLELALDRHVSHGDTSGYAIFIEMLLRDYYDPMYDYQLSKKQQRVQFQGTASEILNFVAGT